MTQFIPGRTVVGVYMEEEHVRFGTQAEVRAEVGRKQKRQQRMVYRLTKVAHNDIAENLALLGQVAQQRKE